MARASQNARSILDDNQEAFRNLLFSKSLFSGRRSGQISKRVALSLAALGPIFAVVTALVLDNANNQGVNLGLLRGILLLDFCYVVALGALIAWRINKLILARRQQSAGSNLHLRLTSLFSFMAVAPAVIVAVFSTITISFGMEAWFSSNVNSVVQNSMKTAEAYATEHLQRIRGDALAMANDLNRAGAISNISGAQFEDIFRQQSYLRELPKAYILDNDMNIKARGDLSFLYGFSEPTPEQFELAKAGEVVLVQDQKNNEMRALLKLNNVLDSYLYVSRAVDGDVLKLLASTKETVEMYKTMERQRDSILINFGLLYIGFTMLIIFAAIWLGIWFADRLARPVVRLVSASEKLAGGDYDVRVREGGTNDEISTLSRTFNHMISKLKKQRDDLIQAHDDVDQRRVFIEAVLSGATAGIIGINAFGKIDLVNKTASYLLERDLEKLVGEKIIAVLPEFSNILDEAYAANSTFIESEVRITVGSNIRHFMVRLTAKNAVLERQFKGIERDPGTSYVITFDDMTDLVEAQRLAAWGDVARRIAHEIKNPLTPIQLSAERMRHKFTKYLNESDKKAFEQYTNIIVRQAGDVRRMVDEFASFGRLPKPQKEWTDVSEIVKDAVLLQREACTTISYGLRTESNGCKTYCDRGLISQSVTNLLQNAKDAIESYKETIETIEKDIQHVSFEIDTHVYTKDNHLFIDIQDNGIGFEQVESRRKLLEPYVTTRANGTGLGLAIVRKIIEEHGGQLRLLDRSDATRGALAQLSLPLQYTE